MNYELGGLNFNPESLQKFLQSNIIFGLSLLIIGALIILIFFNLGVPPGRAFILRSIFLIIILSISLLINKEMIISIIPHTITI